MPARPSASRRTVLRTAALVPAAGLGLAACSPGDSRTAATPTAPVDLGEEGGVAKGGAVLHRDHHVVVARAEDGSLRAYSSLCTHAACPIDRLEGTRLTCPCHGSEFDALTGEVLRRPATAPLKELPVRAENGRIIAGPAA